MAVNSINADQLKTMFFAGASALDARKEWVNEQNVFPVPDGDTGTNMTLTMLSAIREIQSLPQVTMAGLAKAISSGSLRGARGNSGVILSQLLRGFCREIAEKEELSGQDIASALGRATETAYKAVMKPKEGTILTVAREMTERAKALAEREDLSLGEFFEEILVCGDEALAHTPELLPVLKQAGVVDSGGQGLMQILKGAVDGYFGRSSAQEPSFEKPVEKPATSQGVGAAYEGGEIVFGYCTEFLIDLSRPFTEADELDFKGYLESLGDCVVVVPDDEIVKVHVHSNDPGLVLQRALTYGALTHIKIDNMREQHEERVAEGGSEPEKVAEPAEREACGIVVVSIGSGMNEIFEGLNVSAIIEGGQTMNPSTEDFLNAIASVNADTVYVLPNNKNIILAAEQARELTEDKEVVVIPSRTVPQGITAIINFSAEATAEENREAMTEAMQQVKTGQVTYAVRDTCVDGKEIHEGDIMGIGDHAILAVGQETGAVTAELIGALVDETSELISIYYGSDVPEEEAEALAERIGESYPELDVELYLGGQPIYYYVLSVE